MMVRWERSASGAAELGVKSWRRREKCILVLYGRMCDDF